MERREGVVVQRLGERREPTTHHHDRPFSVWEGWMCLHTQGPVPIALQTAPQHPAAAGQPWPDWGKGWLIPCPCGCVCWLGLGSESVGLSFWTWSPGLPGRTRPFSDLRHFCQLFFRGIPHSLFPSPAAWPKLTLALLLWEEEARRGAAAPRGPGQKKTERG